MLKEIFNLLVICMETMQGWLGDKSCFSHANASNFRPLLQSLLLRHTAENAQVS